MLITIVAFLGVLIVLILAHELGHFITAKASGVRVEEFGIGFPPRLFAIKWGETEYSVNVVFLGGFVKMSGEEDPGVTGSLASKSRGIRLLVLSAGSIMNAILPLLLLSIAFMVPHEVVTGQVMVQEVAPNSPAAVAGIKAGDILLKIDGKPISNTGDLRRYVELNLGDELKLLVKHGDSTTEEIRVRPRWRPPEGQGAIGIAVRTANPIVIRQSEPFWRAIPMGVGQSIESFVVFNNALVSMFVGAAPVELTGPVGIAQITGEIARSGISPLLEFAAFLSINLAIINIFPLPALDGGRVVFVLIEWARRGKRVSPKIERMVHLIGFALLMALFVIITYRDVMRIIGGENLVP